MSEIDFGLASDVPDSIEPIYGLRTFTVDRYGRLRPWNNLMKTTHIYTPGENVSEHVGYSSDDFLFSLMGQKKTKEPHSPHTCNYCGFYAYTDAQSARENHVGPFHVAGIIEAYGKVAQGPLGFRAQKCRVVALHVPGPPFWLRRLIVSLRPWMMLAFGVLMFLTGIAVDFFYPDLNVWVRRSFAGASGLAFGDYLIWKWQGGGPRGGKAMQARLLLRKNYPEVKFYNRRKAMMMDYGIRKAPHLPSPEEEDFWEKEAPA